MTDKDRGLPVSEVGKTITTIHYAKKYQDEVKSFNIKNGVGKLTAVNVKTSKIVVLTINSNGQLSYIDPPNSTRSIDDGNWDFVLTEETIDLINNFKSQQEAEKNTVSENIDSTRRPYNFTIGQLIAGVLSKPVENPVVAVVEKEVVIGRHKTEFSLNMNQFNQMTMDGVAQLYLETIDESLVQARLELERKKMKARTISTHGEIVNMKPILRAVNAVLNDRDIQFQYGRRSQDSFTRNIIVTVNLD